MNVEVRFENWAHDNLPGHIYAPESDTASAHATSAQEILDLCREAYIAGADAMGAEIRDYLR